MGMFRKLIKIMARIIVALNDGRTIRRKAYIPANVSDLGHDERSFPAHLAHFIPHREHEALYGCPGLGMMSKQVLALIDGIIGYFTGLLIHRSGHSAAVEVVDRVPVVTEPYTGARDMYLAVLQDRNYPYRIDRMRIDGADSRMLDKDLF